ncbi:serine protease inhibitor 2 [Leptinotarsa decemlineata]|uniref:serine protease inhibitor 2 n=1 Tax=Leptinotarsa decemlineata TaxID=7539 RepID=UPI000C2538AB|nr:serine protease inhibitor 27A-like [Leptinotarsa decemlineata]
MLVLWFIGIILGISVRGIDLTTLPEDIYYPSNNWSDTFDWKIFKEVSSDFRNTLISPISIKIVLALLYEGSSGVTKREFENVLQFTDKADVQEQYRDILNKLQATETSEYVLNMGTRIFLDTPIEPKQKFASIAQDSFKADIVPTNFSYSPDASQTINSWVEKLTNGKISKLVDTGDLQDAIMVIANAVYFRGSWRYQFPRDQTQLGKFYVPDANGFLTINTPFMSTNNKFYFLESPTLDAKIIRLPYKGGRYSMFILLPNSKGGLPMLMKSLSLHNLKNLLYLMDLRLVHVQLPKFKFDYQVRLSKPLQDFGLLQMFQNTASFPGIARGNSSLLRKLVVSDIIQKSGIEIDEEGSVVYAASEITVGNKFGEPQSSFHANHPFMFYIEEELTGTILFVGKCENPLEEDPASLAPRPTE